MAIAKGYWRLAKSQYNWDFGTSSCDGVLVDASNLNAHSRNFNYTFSVGSKINDGFNINGFITEAVSHPRSGSFSILKVYHDRNMNFLFDKDSKRFPRSADPLIGRVDLPHSDPWYERSIYHQAPRDDTRGRRRPARAHRDAARLRLLLQCAATTGGAGRSLQSASPGFFGGV